ncbi:MAG: tetratricopeptide repeat protein [Limisphaerales bacterium]
MSDLLTGLLAALISTNPAAGVSNVIQNTTGIAPKIEIANPNDPVEKQYLQLLADDNAAQDEVDKWIRDNEEFRKKGAGAPEGTLRLRIEQRFEPVKKAYERFLQEHPTHTKARLAYGSFLNDIHDEDGAVTQWEKARELDPKDPAAWNNLANIYAHRSPIKKGFEYYEKAIELNPKEPVYIENLAVCVYMFRTDAKEYYHLTEDQVFDKALALYRQAMKLDPNNFLLASDYAQSFYGTKPPRYKDGLEAWQNVLPLARDEIEREGVFIHLARIETKLNDFTDAEKHLSVVTNEMYAGIKKTLTRNLKEAQEKMTNSTPIR